MLSDTDDEYERLGSEEQVNVIEEGESSDSSGGYICMMEEQIAKLLGAGRDRVTGQARILPRVGSWSAGGGSRSRCWRGARGSRSRSWATS